MPVVPATLKIHGFFLAFSVPKQMCCKKHVRKCAHAQDIGNEHRFGMSVTYDMNIFKV